MKTKLLLVVLLMSLLASLSYSQEYWTDEEFDKYVEEGLQLADKYSDFNKNPNLGLSAVRASKHYPKDSTDSFFILGPVDSIVFEIAYRKYSAWRDFEDFSLTDEDKEFLKRKLVTLYVVGEDAVGTKEYRIAGQIGTGITSGSDYKESIRPLKEVIETHKSIHLGAILEHSDIISYYDYSEFPVDSEFYVHVLYQMGHDNQRFRMKKGAAKFN